jgi:hypothetical protein
MEKVLILVPRLDCSFKRGHVPAIKGAPNHPIRNHYETFLKRLTQRHLDKGDQVVIEEKALWQFNPEDYKTGNWDLIYIPHKQKYQFDVGDAGRYYMQQVIPNIFSIDPKGWGADGAFNPIEPMADSGAFDYLSQRIKQNTSKFKQPKFDPDFTDTGYIFFACQLPHDETIKLHSHVSVLEALRRTLDFAKVLKKKVVVKGHPINPGSMTELRELTLSYALAYNHVTWTDSLSVHQLIAQSDIVSLVNSGVGLEALLHEKPVVAFGSSDYTNDNPLVMKGSRGLDAFNDAFRLSNMITSPTRAAYYQLAQNKKSIQGWYSTYYDVERVETFQKI